MLERDDAGLYHDDLAAVNDPALFHQFAGRAGATACSTWARPSRSFRGSDQTDKSLDLTAHYGALRAFRIGMSGRWFFASGVASLFFLSLHAQHSQAHRAVRAAPKAQPSSLQLDEVVIDASVQPQIGTNDTGSAVVRAQILLGRSHFSCGVIDGRFGHNLQTTIRAFQGDRNLPVSGVIDDATWKALNADTTVPIAAITISPQDVQGPFYKIPAGIMQQAKLPAMSYQSPLEEFAERYHTSQEVIRARTRTPISPFPARN